MREAGSQQKTRGALVIIGAGGHAVSVANVALSAGYTIRHFVDPKKAGSELLGYRVTSKAEFPEGENACSCAIAIGDNFAREKTYRELLEANPKLCFPPLVHPAATVSFFTGIGEGTVVMPGAVVGPHSNIGRFCLINTLSSVDHDGLMLDFASLAPGALAGGNVRIGRRSAISMGAVIRHGISVGDDSVVGARSYLNKDLESHQVAYGTPAKPVRARDPGDPYLG